MICSSIHLYCNLILQSSSYRLSLLPIDASGLLLPERDRHHAAAQERQRYSSSDRQASSVDDSKQAADTHQTFHTQLFASARALLLLSRKMDSEGALCVLTLFLRYHVAT
jgi:hypothetical protein